MSAKLFIERLESRQMMSGSSEVFRTAASVDHSVGAVSVHATTNPTTTLPAPVIISQGSSASPGPVLTTTAPTFTWQAVTGVNFTGYQINLENLTTRKFVSFVVGKSATQLTPPASALAAGDSFVWNLRLRNGDKTGPESAYFYFQTAAPVPLTAPTILGPGNATAPGTALTTSDPTFTWQAITGVNFTGYQINLENMTTNKFVSFVVGKSATQFTPPAGALAAGDAFVWNLRLRNGDKTGPESAYFYFQTPALASASTTVPTAPTILGPGASSSPGTLLTTSTPTFTWDAVTGVNFTGYQINLEDLTANKFVSIQVGKSVTQFTPSAGALVAGDTFVWNLRLRNGDTTGPESAYFYFQTPAPTPAPVALVAPTILGPGDSSSSGTVLTTSTPTFTWQAVTGVTFTSYQINLFDKTTSKFVTFLLDPSMTQFTPPAGTLTSGDTFIWNLRLRNGDTTGPESAYFTFKMP